MKQTIKSILAFVALMLCGGAWADAMPVAVWAGNFETKTQGAFTLDLNGNSESTDHSKITINQNVGVKVDTTTAVSGITVLFRVENLEVGESVKTLATASTDSNAGNDRIGIYLDANGQTHGIWNNTGTHDTGATTQSSLASIENTAYMALAYSTGGTSFYINTGSGYKAAHVNGTQMSSDDTSLYGVCVGGTRSHGTNFAAASGMVITGIAVFNEKFGNTIALSNYQFPDEAQVWLHSKFGSQHNAANEISSSAKVVFPGIKTLEDLQNNYVLSGTINGDWMKDSNFSYTVYPVKIAEEKSNDTLTSLTMQFHGVNDGNMKVASVEFTCGDDGISAQQTEQLYLTPDNGNAATYLFKQKITSNNTVGVGDYTIYSLAAYPKTKLNLPAATAKVISWNVAQGTTAVSGKGAQKTLVGEIPEDAWTEKAGVNQYVSTDYTDVKVYDVASGETTTDTSIKFRWNVSGATNYGYLKVGDNANDAAIESDYEYMGMWLAKLNKDDTATSFSVSGIPFMSYDVILYYNGNAGFDSYQIRPMTINGSKYNVNRMGELVAVGSAVDKKALWGQRGLARPELGVNAGIIKNLSAGTLTITDNAKGGGLAAVQIVEHPVRTTNVTISGDDNLVSTLAAEHSFGKDPIIITANGAATLTADVAWTYGPLILASESGAFTIKGADNLPLDDLDFSRVAESLVFEFDATTTEYTATDKIKAYMATMSDEKVTFLFKGSETTGATVAYTENAPIITGHLVFQGGTHHVFKYNGVNHIFASGASNDHPTILVESDTTLTVYGHDMTGYNATPTSDGIIRVKDRGSLVFENYGASGTTFFYNQRICLDPGAEWTIGESLTGSDFRMTGGSSVDQIFVPESATDATANPARITVSTGAHLSLAKDGSAQGIGINVGANSKLVFDGDVQSLNNDANVATDDETLAARVIEKKGNGLLEIVGGNVSATMKSSAGTLRYVAVSPAATSFGDGTLELAQNENGDAYTFTGTVSSSALGKGVVKTVAGSTVSLSGTFTDYSGDINSTAANSKFVIPVGQEVTVGLIASNSKIEIEGTLANTNKTAGTGQYDYTSYQSSNLSGLTGNGTFKIIGPHYFFTSGKTNFSDYWASTLAICNERGESEPGDNRGIVWGQPPNGNKTISIGTLSGFGMMRTDANDGNRSIKVTQSADSEWSGVFYGTNDRLGTFFVAGKDGATAKTLTLSGTQTHTNDLTIEESGSVKITGTWIATTTMVNGRLEVMNTATLTSPTLTYGYKMDTSDSVIYFGSKDIAEAEAVAQVGDDYYATLEKAFEAASEGEGLSVTLTANVAGDLNVPENMTVNAGSHTIGGEIVIGEGAVVTIAGDRETQGISGRGKLVVTSGIVTAKNKSDGYAVDGATIQIDGGTFKLNLGNDGAFSVAASDPSINDAKFIIGASGTLTNNGWLNISGELSLSSEATKTVFSGSSFRGAPTVVKSGNGAITFDLSNANGSEDYKFTSLTMNAGSLTLKTIHAVDSVVSGDPAQQVKFDSTTKTYSLYTPMAKIVSGETTTYYETIAVAIQAAGDDHLDTIVVLDPETAELPDGYALNSQNKIVKAVARIDFTIAGASYYAYVATLAEAFTVYGGTVTLCQDVVVESTFEMPTFRGVVDFAGHTISGALASSPVFSVANGSMVYLDDSAETKGGILNTAGDTAVVTCGNVKLQAVEIRGAVVTTSTSATAFGQIMVENTFQPTETVVVKHGIDRVTSKGNILVAQAGVGENVDLSNLTNAIIDYNERKYERIITQTSDQGYDVYSLMMMQIVVLNFTSEHATISDKVNVITFAETEVAYPTDISGDAMAFSFTVTPDDGYVVSAVAVNGSGDRVQIVDGRYVVKALSTDSALTVSVTTEIIPVAKIGEVPYPSVAAAIVDATEGVVIDLVANDSVAIALDKNITLNVSSDLTLSGAVTGAYSITKTGAGTLTLSSTSNTFSGGLNVHEGTVKTSADNVLGTGMITVDDDATLNIVNHQKTTGDGGYDVTLNGGTLKHELTAGNADTKFIHSITVPAGKTGYVTGNVIGIGANGAATSLTLNGNLEVNLSSGNFYLRNTTVSGTGTLTMAGGNLLIYGTACSMPDSSFVLKTGASVEIQQDLSIKNVELAGGTVNCGTKRLTVKGTLSKAADVTATIKYLTLGDQAHVDVSNGPISISANDQYASPFNTSWTLWFDNVPAAGAVAFVCASQPPSMPGAIGIQDESDNGYCYTKTVDGSVQFWVAAGSQPIVTPEDAEEPMEITNVGAQGIAIAPNANVKVPTATEPEKIKVVYNGIDLAEAITEGEGQHPKYVSVSINSTTGAVELDTTDDAKPAETAITMSTPTVEEEDQVQFTITNPIPGLFYAVSSCDTPNGDFTSAIGDQATSDAAKTVSIPMAFGENQKVKYYRVNVKATR